MGRSIVGSVLLLLLASGTARAQGTWAVVVAQTGEASPAARRVAEIAAVRLRGHGASVVDVATAQRAVAEGLGLRFEPVPPDFARRLATGSDEVLEHVAFGRSEEGLSTAEPLLERAEQHLAAVGADEGARTHVANLCLFTIRALLQEERETEAQMRALDCLRFLPSLEPDERMHPRDVRDLLTATRDGLSSGPHGVLVVGGEPGCAVHVNGLSLGETPFERAVPPGAYHVQLACGGQSEGRVRRVDVPRGGRAEVTLDTGIAARLDARDGLVLAYLDEPARVELLPRDVAAIGRMLEVRNVLAVSSVEDEVWLERVQSEEGVTASAKLPADPGLSAERIGQAVTALLEGRGVDGGGAADEGGPSVLGYVLGGVGAAGLVASWILYATWVDAQAQVDALDPFDTRTEFQEAVAARDDRGTVVVGLGAASAAVLTLSMPFLLPAEDGVPWWSWIAGAVGLGAIAIGIVHTAQDEAEVDNAMRGVPIRTIPLGPLVAMHGAPLLAIPITHLVRSATGSDATATAALDENGARFSVGGRF